jgi:uncharacterized membrane protein YdfJ with MMPL/SSD domain
LITRLAQFAIRRPVLVLVGWALAVAVLAAVGRGVEQKLMKRQVVGSTPNPGRATGDTFR